MIRTVLWLAGLCLGTVVFFIISSTSPGTGNDYVSPNRYHTGEQYLTIERMSDEFPMGQVKLRINWDASWHDSENWDAAWVFFKDATGKSLQVDKVSVSDAAAVKIPGDRLGFYIYRKEISEGDSSFMVSVFLEGEPKAVEAFGLEMVFVPRGPFELGTVKSFSDRNEINTSRGSETSPLNAFFSYAEEAEDNFGGVFKVSSEHAISIGAQEGKLYYQDAQILGVNTYSGDQSGILPNDFPKGYAPFYQMKYELSEGQYCDFLNNISSSQTQNRINLDLDYEGRDKSAYRNTIYFEGGIYQSKNPLRACNFLSYKDVLAYADWSGLRLMTELEFEKSARGPKPAVWREFVWGQNELASKDAFTYTSTLFDPDGSLANNEDGDEYVDGNVHAILLGYGDYEDVCTPNGDYFRPNYPNCRKLKGGDGGRGPLRIGIHGAQSQGNRTKAGASYYGAMDLGGSLQEPVVPVGSPFSRRYRGIHGDGLLDDNGDANNADWLGEKDTDYVYGFRGGSWPFHENHARTADRFATYRKNPNERKPYRGFRGVRSVVKSKKNQL